MANDPREMFREVFCLLRLLLVFPVSSCESERSFSALRRLKTWLRSTMAQERLHSVIICHVHKEVLDEISLQDVSSVFVSQSEIRKNKFGTL